MIPNLQDTYGESLFTPGHRACPGCGATIAVRAILEASGPDVIVVSPTGCLETFASPYPYAPWGVPWIHPLFENAPAVASGIAAALRQRKQAENTRVIVIAGDGGTYDIGLGALSGMFERGDEVLYICYDNEAYMNTGVQKSGATPLGAHTMTSPSGSRSWGQMRPKKNLAAIALAHGLPYVATASIAYPQDLARKVKAALSVPGAKFINIHSPCPIGWGFDPAQTVEVARLGVQTALIPLLETGVGRDLKVRKLTQRKPVDAYLKIQGRFCHLFEQPEGAGRIALIQALADQNVAEYGLETRG
jgi:pyruvate ferredoxin oxidoreductase beta subunit